MGYWENTTYLRCEDLPRIESELIRSLAGEGFDPVSKPEWHKAQSAEPVQDDSGETDFFWAVALIPGRDGWTIVKTEPLELLGGRAPGGARLRIADLCAALKCDGFINNTYDTIECILVEADSRGRVRVSGEAQDYFRFDDEDQFEMLPYNGEPFVEEGDGFGLIEVSREIQEAFHAFADDEELGRLIGGDSGGHSNQIYAQFLDPHVKFKIPGARALYFGKRDAGRT